MRFDKIGPYDLTRGDLVAAAIIISFLTGARSVRLTAALCLVAGLTMVVSGVVTGTPLIAGLGVLFLVWMFAIAPALRSIKRSREVYIDYSPEGIATETPQVRTTYKWSTIGTAKKVGSRLLIMITDRLALVVPDRSTSQDNMDRLVATLSHERAAADETS
jgi:hypothetical protein